MTLQSDPRAPATAFAPRLPTPERGIGAQAWRGAASCAALLLAACATAPSPRDIEVFGPLTLCSGVAISNAPATDGAGRVLPYTPYVAIRGRVLARAPVAACLSSGFGPRHEGRMHNGVDLYTGDPQPVYAGGDGVVAFVGAYGGYGETILIRHGDGVMTRYAHLSASGVREGRQVRAGERIGASGRTGNATAIHLHYEILVDDQPVNPLTINLGPSGMS